MKKINCPKALIAMCAATLLPFTTLRASTPNIVFILADNIGIGDISAFNSKSGIRTPHLDAMCMNGIRFTSTHSDSPVSAPTRYGILTGRYAFRTNPKAASSVGSQAPLIAPGRSTIANMLGRQGYNTAFLGKWHLGWKWAHDEKRNINYSKAITEGPTARGFDYFYGVAASADTIPYVYVENNMPAAIPDSISQNFEERIPVQRKKTIPPDFRYDSLMPCIWERSVNYITEQKDSDKPFFLYISITAPNGPILTAKEYAGKSEISPYADFVLMTDDMVGDIIATLKKTGQYENTIVIFTSDNGCAPGADIKDAEKQDTIPIQKNSSAKPGLSEGDHRIPLIISWGDRYNGQSESSLLSLTDLYATFAEMTGYAIPDNEAEDSYSMWPILSGQGKSARHDVVHHSGDGYFTLRSGKWKLLLPSSAGARSYPGKNDPSLEKLPQVQLYDMTADPSERKNVQADNPEVVKELTAIMKKYLDEGRSTPGTPQNNDPVKREWSQTPTLMK